METISHQTRKQIDEEVSDAAMASVLNLAAVLVALPHGFDHGAMPQEGRVGRVERWYCHMLARANDELDAMVMM